MRNPHRPDHNTTETSTKRGSSDIDTKPHAFKLWPRNLNVPDEAPLCPSERRTSSWPSVPRHCRGEDTTVAATPNPSRRSVPFPAVKSRRCETLSRRDRSPCRRRTPPSLLRKIVSECALVMAVELHVRRNLPSSFFSAGASSAAPAAGAAPPAAGAAAPPPEPTFRRSSLTSLPSRALAKMEVQMGSISGTLAAEMRDWSLSDCVFSRSVRFSSCVRGFQAHARGCSARVWECRNFFLNFACPREAGAV